MTLALSYLLKKPIIISNIRANRAKGGGLGHQHLTGVLPYIIITLKIAKLFKSFSLRIKSGWKRYQE